MKLENIRGKIESIKNKVDNMENKKVMLIGIVALVIFIITLSTYFIFIKPSRSSQTISKKVEERKEQYSTSVDDTSDVYMQLRGQTVERTYSNAISGIQIMKGEDLISVSKSGNSDQKIAINGLGKVGTAQVSVYTYGGHYVFKVYLGNIVTLNQNGGTGGSNYVYSDGTNIKVDTKPEVGMTMIDIPTKSGYTFTGYYSNLDGTGTQWVEAGGQITINGYQCVHNDSTATWYAGWSSTSGGGSTSADFEIIAMPTDELSKLKPIVQSDISGGVILEIRPSGGNYTIKCSNSSVSISTFSSGYQWQINGTLPIGTTTFTATNSSGKSVSKSITVVAETYTISYNANGGQGAPSSQTKTQGVSLTLSTTRPTRSGYNFLGWSTSSNSATVSYNPGSTYNVDNSVALYAVWQQQEVDATGISLNTDAIRLNVGQTYTLVASVQPSNATNKNVTFSSSNSSVVTVNNSGVVTAIGPGNAVISIRTSNGIEKMCKAYITQPVTGVSLTTTDSTTIKKGQTVALTATVQPSNASDKRVTFKSSKESVATVSGTGLVTAKGSGEATITVTTVDGYKTATCTITVKAPETYTINYDANGGQGAPSSQTKTEGIDLRLSSTKPTRENYNFLGWNTDRNATTASYTSGGIYNVNSGTTLYAIWKPIAVTDVTLNYNTQTIEVKQTIQLIATIQPSNALNKEVTYSSNNPSVAIVNNEGLVTAVDAGQATITVTTKDGNKTATCNITVVKPDVSEIKIEKVPSKTDYFIGEDLNIQDGSIKVTYVDGTEEVLTMTDPRIEITGYDKKTVGDNIIITVTYGEKSATFNINVNSIHISKVEVNERPSKINVKGDKITLEGGTVQVFYNNASIKTIPMSDENIEVTILDTDNSDEKSILLKYKENDEELRNINKF